MDLDEGTKRDSGVIFHKIGIDKTDNDSGYNGWKLRTLSEQTRIALLVKTINGSDLIISDTALETNSQSNSRVHLNTYLTLFN